MSCAGRSVQSPCRNSIELTCFSNGCGLDIGVKDNKIVGVRGRAVIKSIRAVLDLKDYTRECKIRYCHTYNLSLLSDLWLDVAGKLPPIAIG